MITKAQLKAAMPLAKDANLDLYYKPLDEGMAEHNINTPQRMAFFLAQIAHESGSLRYSKEIASGRAYEGRKDLGNVNAGDGVRYKGRGFIQITGRANYAAISKSWGVDFINNPGLLETPANTAKSACWWWEHYGLNKIADTGDFRAVTKKINGGYNGLNDRLAHLARAKKALNIT